MQSAAVDSAASAADVSSAITVRIYHALVDSMRIAHRVGTEAKRAEAEDTARILLAYDDLPLIFRARACMILGLSTQPCYVEWARESVRVLKLGIEHSDGPREATEKLLQECQTVLGWAEADYEEQGGYDDDQGEGTDVFDADKTGEKRENVPDFEEYDDDNVSDFAGFGDDTDDEMLLDEPKKTDTNVTDVASSSDDPDADMLLRGDE